MSPAEILAANSPLLSPIAEAARMSEAKAKRFRRVRDTGLARDYEAAEVALRGALALLQSAVLAESRTIAADRRAIMDCG